MLQNTENKQLYKAMYSFDTVCACRPQFGGVQLQLLGKCTRKDTGGMVWTH